MKCQGEFEMDMYQFVLRVNEWVNADRVKERNGFPGVQWAGVKAGSWQELMMSDSYVSPELYNSVSLQVKSIQNFCKGL